MNQLIKTTDLAPILSKNDTVIVLASASALISALEYMSVIEPLTDFINEALVITGQKKISKEDVAIMAKLLTDELLAKYENFKIDEIRLAIKSGAFGEYGEEVVYVSAKNLLKWCKDYQKAKHEILIKQIKHDEILREEDRINKEKENEVRYFNHLPLRVDRDARELKEKLELRSCAWIHFNSLQTIGIIIIKNEIKLAKFEEVMNNLKEGYAKMKKSIEIGDLEYRSKNICRLHFYQEYLYNIKDWETEKKRIAEKVDLMDKF